MMQPMQSDFKEDAPNPAEVGKNKEHEKRTNTPIRQRSFLSRWMDNLVGMGLGESLLRIGTNLFSIIAIVIVIMLVQAFYGQAQSPLTENTAQASGPAATAVVDIGSIPALDVPIFDGISRSAQIHTNVPSRPRQEISVYTV